MKQLSGDGNKNQEHVNCSYTYQTVSSITGVEFGSRIYVGVDTAEHFLNDLQEDHNRYIMPFIEKDVDMIWDGEAKERFLFAMHCHILYT